MVTKMCYKARMKEFPKKVHISYIFIRKIGYELAIDLFLYYLSSYPLLLIIGDYKRIKRRIKYLWFPKSPGRPPTPENIIDLILDMKRSNLFWGAKRIMQELRLMGIHIHKKTIKRILLENGLTTPPMKYQPPTWQSLVVSGKQMWAMDFCNIIDLKLFQIYILGIININTRELLLLSVTISPNREWILQQFRNLTIDKTVFPQYLVVDNDGIYGNWIDPVLEDYFGVQVLRINPRCPWENGFIERFWKGFQDELIDRLHIKNMASIRFFCREYQSYFNQIRPHQGIEGSVPSLGKIKGAKIFDLKSVKYIKTKHVNGLFTEFQLAA